MSRNRIFMAAMTSSGLAAMALETINVYSSEPTKEPRLHMGDPGKQLAQWKSESRGRPPQHNYRKIK